MENYKTLTSLHRRNRKVNKGTREPPGKVKPHTREVQTLEKNTKETFEDLLSTTDHEKCIKNTERL